MSNPVTNSDVEDVLSSIRRLVNDNRRPGTAVPKVQDPGRLVLTPQLRVTDMLQEAGKDQDTAPEVLTLLPEDVVTDAEALDPYEEPLTSYAPDNTGKAEEEPGTAPEPMMDLSEKIAALEMAIARTADQWEPDGDGRDAYAGTRAPAMSWRDDVELDGKGSPLNLSEDMHPVATVDMSPEAEEEGSSIPDVVVDEESLRDLVADIVRSELQGEMGERITRNVRKLVRREILRALAARDLD